MPNATATTLPDGSPVPPAVAGNDFLADVLASPGGRKELGAAMDAAKREGRGPEVAAAKAAQAAKDAAVAGTLADGRPHDAQGRTVDADPRFRRQGQAVTIRANGKLRDGGMGDCRGKIYGSPYVGDGGEVVHSVATESGEIVGVAEHALEARVPHARRSGARSVVVPRGAGFHTHQLVTGANPRACGPHCNPDVGKHCLETHQSRGDRLSA